MNCFLLADKPGIPIALVVLAVVFLVFSGGRFARRRYRDEQYCRRGSSWGFVPLVIILGGLAFYFSHQRPSSRVEMTSDSGRAQVRENRRNKTIVVDRGVLVTSDSPDPTAAPTPALVDWSPAPEIKIAETKAAEPQEIALADTTEAPAKPDAPKAESARPAWVDASPGKVDGVYRTRASSGPWSTEAECDKALNDELRRTVGKYFDDLRSDDVQISSNVPLSYIKQKIVKETFRELVDSPSVGPMFQLHALLEFTPQVQQELQDRYRSSVVKRKLEVTAAGATVVFALLGSLFGFLKLDAFTQGKYRWMLGGALALIWSMLALIVLNS